MNAKLLLSLTCSCLHLKSAVGHEVLEESTELSLNLIVDLAFCTDRCWDVWGLALDALQVHLLEFSNLTGLELIKVSTDTGEKNNGLLLDGHWNVLFLLEKLSKFLSSVKELLGGSIKIGTELGESSDLSELSELKLEGTGDLLHGLNLSSRSDTGHRETDVNSWTNSLVEKLSLEENLSISNRDDIGWDIGGHITSLSLNDWEGSEGSSSVVLVHLSCTLKKT